MTREIRQANRVRVVDSLALGEKGVPKWNPHSFQSGMVGRKNDFAKVEVRQKKGTKFLGSKE